MHDGDIIIWKGRGRELQNILGRRENEKNI
jgi:hypothetical protein